MQAFARHRHSHPFWQYDPVFYGERALGESDFFTDDEFVELPMAGKRSCRQVPVA
jgi:hypothetical protein